MSLWLLLLVASVVYYLYWHFVTKRKDLPPSLTPLPILGNILSLDPKDIAGSLSYMQTRLGDTFTFWFGGQPQVFMANLQLLKEVVGGSRTADAFAGRPKNFLFEAFSRKPQVGIVFSTGKVWSDTRRFSLHVLRDFGFGKSTLEDPIREEGAEMNLFIKDLMNGQRQATLDPTDPIAICVINVISRVVFGRSFGRNSAEILEIRACIDEMTRIFIKPTTLIMAANPWIRHVPLLNHFGYDDIMAVSDKFWTFLDDQIKESLKEAEEDSDPRSFVEAFWQEMQRKQGEADSSFTEFQLSRTIGDFWSAGFETTVTTLRWAVAYMATHPEAQAKVQAELDGYYGGDESRAVRMEDKLSLPYTCATITETQRLANILPFNIDHLLTRDVQVGQWTLKAGTIVIPNIGSVMTDPKIFPEPDLFRPERFIVDGKYGNAEGVMPFGLGKRMCAGEPLARMELFILFVMLMRRFRFAESPEYGPIPLTPVLSQTRKPAQYQVLVTERC